MHQGDLGALHPFFAQWPSHTGTAPELPSTTDTPLLGRLTVNQLYKANRMENLDHPRDYDDIPGTYVFDSRRLRAGYALNMFCKSLDLASNREAFRSDVLAYMAEFDLTPGQHNAVVARDWIGMLQLGGNIYYTFKLAIFDGLSMQHVGAAMSREPMTVVDFREMMSRGGRPIQGNRSRKGH